MWFQGNNNNNIIIIIEKSNKACPPPHPINAACAVGQIWKGKELK